MPEDEQKRRNCESAKRSRLKKMQELAIASARVEQLEAENRTLLAKLAECREWGCQMALHVASRHAGCSCASHASHQKLEKIMAAPAQAPAVVETLD